MSEGDVTPAPTFAQFGDAFQEGLVQALLQDSRWAQQMSEVIRLEYFDKRHLQFLVERFFAYNKQYKTFPSLAMLVTAVKDELRTGSDVAMRDAIIAYIKRVRSNPDPGDLPYIKDRALSFCRRQAMKDALESSIDLINASNYDDVVTTMRRALAVGTLPSVGHKFFDDVDARLERVSRICVPTGIPELDANGILGGGLGGGELGVIAANTGVGKSHFLVQMGANAVLANKNVVHYTFELNERYTGIRYDSNLCDIPSNDIYDSKEKVKLRYQAMKDAGKHGRLIVKEYPTNTCSVVTIRNHLERVEVTEGFRPDLVIVDYADIMKSTRRFDSLRHELKLVYEELRTLAQDAGVPIWTGSQAHRDSANAEVVGLENMAEAYGKAMVADFVATISRKPLEKSTGTGRLYIAKNRMGRDGLVYPISIDTATSRIKVTSSVPMDPAEVGRRDSAELKEALRVKWERVQAETKRP